MQRGCLTLEIRIPAGAPSVTEDSAFTRCAGRAKRKCVLALPGRSGVENRCRRFERRGRLRRRAQGTPLSLGQRPNELWCTDYRASFCWAIINTVTRSRSPITPAVICSVAKHFPPPEKTSRLRCFRFFNERGLPANIRSDNGVPFASAHALFNLRKLAIWWLRLGIGLRPWKDGLHLVRHGHISNDS
jgi:hypothetical protein